MQDFTAPGTHDLPGSMFRVPLSYYVPPEDENFAPGT